MKEFHIITIGASIITNAQKNKVAGLTGSEKVSDEKLWQSKLKDTKFLNEIKNFLSSNPKQNSAELNTFLRLVDGKEPENISIYLISTKTAIGEICRITLENYLKDRGYELYTGKEVSGYFWESSLFDEEYAKDSFKKDIVELLDRLIYLATKKKEEGYKVYFNPTGGLKAHVMTSAIAGFLTNSEVYYMNEEFNEVVFLPPLLYLPKGKELQLLQELSDKVLVSGKKFKDVEKEFSEEIERLSLYGLIEVEEDKFGKVFRMRITDKGLFIWKELSVGK